MHELTKDSKTFFHFPVLQTFRKLTIVGRRKKNKGTRSMQVRLWKEEKRIKMGARGTHSQSQKSVQ